MCGSGVLVCVSGVLVCVCRVCSLKGCFKSGEVVVAPGGPG